MGWAAVPCRHDDIACYRAARLSRRNNWAIVFGGALCPVSAPISDVHFGIARRRKLTFISSKKRWPIQRKVIFPCSPIKSWLRDLNGVASKEFGVVHHRGSCDSHLAFTNIRRLGGRVISASPRSRWRRGRQCITFPTGSVSGGLSVK